MRKSLLPLMCLSLLTACGPESEQLDIPEAGSTPDMMGTDSARLAALPKLRVSSNGRFLVKEDGSAFFWMADTAWQLLPWLNRSEVVTYLSNRAARGFNVIQAVALGPLTGSHSNVNGDFPFVNHNFTAPATTTGSDPNDPTQYDFWDHVDFIINEAEARGIYTALLPAWGTLVADGYLTTANAQAYGRFLGSRYANKPIIWVLGGDVSPEGKEAVWRALAKGIAIGTSGTEDYSKVLMTYHPKGGTKSSTWFHNEPWLDFNMQQNGHCTNTAVYERITYDYNLASTKPTLDGEPLYEQFPICFNTANGYSNDYEVRKYAYWSVFAGAFGHTYGHNSVWQMYAPGRNPQFSPVNYWNEGINAPGAAQMQYLRRLIESRPMLVRIPDQGVLASSAGTDTHRIQATRGSDGSYAFVYSASGQAFSVNMSRVSGGTVRATWYNPRNGATTQIGSYANTGTRQFTPPSSGAGNDWVLILDDATRNFPLPGSTTPPPTEPPPAIGFTLVSATVSPTTVSRGGTVRLSSTFQAKAATSGVNVKLDVRNATGTSTVTSNPIANQSFTQGQTRTFQLDYVVPSTPGTYCLATGVSESTWASWYVWENCAAKFTVQ